MFFPYNAKRQIGDKTIKYNYNVDISILILSLITGFLAIRFDFLNWNASAIILIFLFTFFVCHLVCILIHNHNVNKLIDDFIINMFNSNSEIIIFVDDNNECLGEIGTIEWINPPSTDDLLINPSNNYIIAFENMQLAKDYTSKIKNKNKYKAMQVSFISFCENWDEDILTFINDGVYYFNEKGKNIPTILKNNDLKRAMKKYKKNIKE